MSSAADRIYSWRGAIDLLIAAAGIQGPIGPFADTSPRFMEDTLRTNVLGVMNTVHAVLPQMIDRRSGKIIVLAGGGAATNRPNFSSYAASKAAIVRFVECIAAEVCESNVQINCLGPGAPIRA